MPRTRQLSPTELRTVQSANGKDPKAYGRYGKLSITIGRHVHMSSLDNWFGARRILLDIFGLPCLETVIGWSWVSYILRRTSLSILRREKGGRQRWSRDVDDA